MRHAACTGACPRVLLTDCAWPELEIERRVLATAGAELILADRADADTLSALAGDVAAIMTCWARVTRQVIDAAPHCRIIARLGIGLDNIDVAAATQRGILVTNVPDYCRVEVAEHALALLLALARKVAFYHHQTKRGQYDLHAGPTLFRVEGRTLGIVGLGSIGRCLAEKARALGMRVLATSRQRRDLPPGIEWRPLEELLAESDYVSMHVPATAETVGMFDARRLAGMKQGACLINTARGAGGRGGAGRRAGKRASGRRGTRRAVAGAARPVAPAAEPSARHRHAARRVRLVRVAGRLARAGQPAGSRLAERPGAAGCRES